MLCLCSSLAPHRAFAQDARGAASLRAPWQRSPSTSEAAPPAPAPAAPPPPPGRQDPAAIAAPAQPALRGPSVRFESDDTPVEVYLVTGTREVTQLVSVPAAPTSAMVFGASTFGPLGPMGSTLPTGFSPYGTTTPTEVIEARTTVEERRFLCRTPCTTQLPPGVRSLHLRTLGVSLGTESATIPAAGARFRVRTTTVGLYTIGQASLWVGVGLVITGITLLVQSQTGCGSRGCSPWPGVGVTIAGALSVSAGIPLVVMNSRRLEALGVRSVALGLGSLSLRF